jgi:deazaflavin-dependent oxidoreductase (nitroreductase family)
VRRTSPLMYHEDGDAIAVAASKAGQPTHPAWFHNLKANPDTAIQIGSVVREVRARIATDEERNRLWPEFVGFYPGYEFFRRNAKGRRIPIVILNLVRDRPASGSARLRVDGSTAAAHTRPDPPRSPERPAEGLARSAASAL